MELSELISAAAAIAGPLAQRVFRGGGYVAGQDQPDRRGRGADRTTDRGGGAEVIRLKRAAIQARGRFRAAFTFSAGAAYRFLHVLERAAARTRISFFFTPSPSRSPYNWLSR